MRRIFRSSSTTSARVMRAPWATGSSTRKVVPRPTVLSTVTVP